MLYVIEEIVKNKDTKDYKDLYKNSKVVEYYNNYGYLYSENKIRFDYYEECQKPCVKVAIFSGESRTFANILLTVGVA